MPRPADRRDSVQPISRGLPDGQIHARQSPAGFDALERRTVVQGTLQARLDRWYDNAYRDDNLFLTMARRPGLLDATWGFIKYIYGGGSTVEPEQASDADEEE